MYGTNAELIARQLADAADVKRIWGGLMYVVTNYGIVGDGVTNNTSALQALINEAIAAGRRTIFFPHGVYFVSELTNADQVDFVGDNSSFTGGYSGEIANLGSDAALKADFEKHTGRVFSPLGYGAVSGGVIDDTAAIIEAMDEAAAVGEMSVVDLGGLRYRMTSPLEVKSKVILRNGTIVNDTLTAGQAGIVMGVPTGGSLVRPAGVENVRFETSSTANGIVGFRMDTLVRSCWFKNCYAQMNEDGTGTRQQIGFEIISAQSAQATTGGVGAYQNLIENCTGYQCYSAYKISTRNYTNDPQANANRITDCNAYSCVHSALILGPGSQDNVIRGLRADTFTVGTSTDIAVVDIYGNYNYVEVWEEVGSSSGTQYTVRFRAGAIYNHVDYNTHQVVTAAVLDSNAVPKNTSKFITQLDSFGGDTATFDYYTTPAIPVSVTQEIRYNWIAPRKCLVLGVVANLDAAVASGNTFQVYAAKNYTFSVSNRIDFAAGEGLVAKELVIDPSAGTAINDRWLLNKGDRLTFAFTNGPAAPIYCAVTAIVKYLG